MQWGQEPRGRSRRQESREARVEIWEQKGDQRVQNQGMFEPINFKKDPQSQGVHGEMVDLTAVVESSSSMRCSLLPADVGHIYINICARHEH